MATTVAILDKLSLKHYLLQQCFERRKAKTVARAKISIKKIFKTLMEERESVNYFVT